MKPIYVAQSPLSNRIYAGYLATTAKAGISRWAQKIDVTGAACAAVAEHVLQAGSPVIVTENGTPVYEIEVKKLKGDK
jgi:hypothetical protein